ncbi:T9SS type A sorting domain-containing protein [bacterium]|nr:T9SS type A sorting domain-containing protein [bacterium]RQV94399.1 MAG: T9SS C-terminal target domain-containing protein [bacterium]
MKRRIIILFFLFNISLNHDFGFACLCPPPPPPKVALKNSDAVFIGQVIEMTIDTTDTFDFLLAPVYRVKLTVYASWKRAELGEIIITTFIESSLCGYPFEKDTTYLVYASMEEDTLFAGRCSRTKKLTESDYDLSELGFPTIGKLPAGFPRNPILCQNYPNPFNVFTIIKYSIPRQSVVTLKLYNPLGKEVYTLVDEFQEPTTYSFNFDASGLSNGVYFYRLQVENQFVETKKMVLIR